MHDPLFFGQTQIEATAIFLGQRLELKAFDQASKLATSPLVVTAGQSGCAILFRYGCVVLFGVNSIEKTAFLNGIKSLVVEPVELSIPEHAQLVLNKELNEGVEDEKILLHRFSLERLQLVADVLAKSEVLAHYEAGIAKNFDTIEPLAESLQREGRTGSHGKKLLRHIGDTLSIQGRMVGRVEISEKPELLWDYPQLERFYLRLRDEYDIAERHTALEKKLDLLSKTAETLLTLLHNKHSLRVEWYITLLIVFEIVLTLYEMLF